MKFKFYLAKDDDELVFNYDNETSELRYENGDIVVAQDVFKDWLPAYKMDAGKRDLTKIKIVGVNTDGSGMTLTSDYSITESVEQNPIIGWKEPGLKNITLEVTDDDGNTSTASLQVLVINQRPVAVFARPSDGQIDTENLKFIDQDCHDKYAFD